MHITTITRYTPQADVERTAKTTGFQHKWLPRPRTSYLSIKTKYCKAATTLSTNGITGYTLKDNQIKLQQI
jgi:hypothetical protein